MGNIETFDPYVEENPFRFSTKNQSMFKLVIGDDRQLYLISFETHLEDSLAEARIQTQPEGWPIKGFPIADASTK